MSNRIDFYAPEQRDSAIPSMTISVLLDGTLCPFIEPIEIIRAGLPEFSWARLRYNPAAWPEGAILPAQGVETALGMGKSICVQQIVNSGAPGVAALMVPVFEGRIENLQTDIGPKGQRVEFVARDISATLKRIAVYGRRVADSDGSTFLAGMETVFNDRAKGNASGQAVQNNGKIYTAFCANPSEGRLWKYGEVLLYLLSEYAPAGQLRIPGLEQLDALTQSQTSRDLDVTGLNLIEALQRCCQRVGLEFKFVPRFSPTGPRQAILFYRPGTGRIVELNRQASGEQLSISKTNIAALHSKRSFWPETGRWIVQGDFKVFEATFELVKAWEPSLEDVDYEKFSPLTNQNFYEVKNVFRKWCLNEAGDYSGEPYNQGPRFDFSQIFESSNFIGKRRRFQPALTTDKTGTSLGYFLEVSYDDGEHWWQYLYAFDNLLDECGIWLSSEQLDLDTWFAALKGVLKFRITASVVSDERLSVVCADGPVDSVAETVDHPIYLPRQFKYRKVSNKSIFANKASDSLGAPDEVDDSDALGGFARQLARQGGSSAIIETIDVQTPLLALDYRLGDRTVTSPDSSDLIGCRLDNRSIYWVERVRMDFVNQCTNLRILRKRA